MINKILFITLSNIGDVILTLPVLDSLREQFPGAKITVLSGSRPKEIFENNPLIDKLIIYNRHCGLKKKIKLFFALKKERFDIIIDLRNSAFGVLLTARHKTSLFRAAPENITHMKERHLYKATLSAQEPGVTVKGCSGRRNSLYIKPEDETYIKGVLKQNNINEEDKIIVISPGARSHVKRWPQERFIGLISKLKEEFKAKIILAGDRGDCAIAAHIKERLRDCVIDLTAKTTLAQLAALLKKSELVISNDSAVLHLASYLEAPVVAVFGPTDEAKYGPWSVKSAVAKKDIFCRPCEKAQCRFGTLKCMQLIKVEDVLRQVRNILAARQAAGNKNDFKRILIVRTDRIGDVLLSTPVIKALRDSYPQAYIAMMVSPYAKEIVEGNPYLDEIIIYDKDYKHKSWMRSIKFSQNLKKRKFDLALILHPTNRAHLVTFLSGIKRRIGYERKLGFLLTDRIKHTKQLGEKQESEYAFDLVRYLGIEPEAKMPFMPIKQESENWVEELFAAQGIIPTDKLLGIHPAASCPSKIWPNERFVQVADRLTEKYGFKVIYLSGAKDSALVQKTVQQMRYPAINLAGKTSLSQLASILKRCALFISNDSGPVHIASAVGVPVISIFGRNQAGLSPKRWGPLGLRDKILHKEVGCIECLAHNCTKQFACLRAISVDDVLNAADEILSIM